MKMTCRDEILACIQQITKGSSTGEFSIKDVVSYMERSGSEYEASIIRTHIASKLCSNAPNHHDKNYDDLIRVSRGIYRLR